MKGAIRMVAMRSRLFSMVRVAMIAGTAQPYAESSGMKLLPCKPDARHGAVGDQRGARQVAGILQDADEEEQQQHLRQENDHRCRRPSRCRPPSANVSSDCGQRRCNPVAAELRSASLTAFFGRIGARHEDGADHADHDQHEDQRAGDRDAERRESRRRVHLGAIGGAIAGLAADRARPTRGTSARPAGPAAA